MRDTAKIENTWVQLRILQVDPLQGPVMFLYLLTNLSKTDHAINFITSNYNIAC